MSHFGRYWPPLRRILLANAEVSNSMPNVDRLDSWKQIARYLNRSVRTVRRWESEGLPVQRHVHRALGSVFAVKTEVDAWRQSRTRASAVENATQARTVPLRGPSMAVLPFANLSGTAKNDYFVDGLTEEVTTTLSRMPGLRVVSRTSAMTLRDSTKKAKAIAKLLGVRYLLQGSVRRARRQVRISAQLIDAQNDLHLWAKAYNGNLDKVFAIQGRLARGIADALTLHLTSRDEQQIAEYAIDNFAAYECYLRARYESWRWRKDAIGHAVELLEEGLRIVGDNARLYGALGMAYLQFREAGIDLSEHPMARAEACAAKVFVLAPNSAAALQLRGWISYSRAQLQTAVYQLKAALNKEPNNADTLLLLCNCYLISGQGTAARPLLKRLAVVDPLTPLTRCMPAFADVMEGKLRQAIGPYREMFEMDRTNPMAALFYAWVLLMNRRSAEADNVVAACPPELRTTLPGQIMRFLSLACAGKVRQAQSVLTKESEAVGRGTDVFARFLAQGYAYAGEGKAAMRWLRVATERGFINYPFLAHHDPAFKSLRADSQFQRLLRDVRRRWIEFQP
jgi:TolB-like protein/thioredoxin-like negative regulator of GroEL